ncbi:MAG TPA: RluA family pseudouridine synthase [Candidatus Saccharimonadales bacterium]|nr:RluA family pseudouridine synthase [Candidatus Saccharimonadales bacterium]
MASVTHELHTFTVEVPERLDVFLASVLPEYSRSFLQKLCREGQVTVQGTAQYKSGAIVQPEQQVIVAVPSLSGVTEGNLPILYEDDDVVVMNKPAGVLTHAKGPLSTEFTVGEFMRSRTTDGADGNRPGIVHRLDRDTSGVIIAAKHPEAKRWIQKQFATRKVKKKYIALVTGHPRQPAAVLQLPIERNPKKPQTYRVGSNGKPAETTYETLKTYASYTLLAFTPHTGRTHQLRVHAAYIGCPIVGDPLYGQPEPALGRMFLHAQTLELTLPSRERKVFEAPLPPELVAYLETLK